MDPRAIRFSRIVLWVVPPTLQCMWWHWTKTNSARFFSNQCSNFWETCTQDLNAMLSPPCNSIDVTPFRISGQVDNTQWRRSFVIKSFHSWFHVLIKSVEYFFEQTLDPHNQWNSPSCWLGFSVQRTHSFSKGSRSTTLFCFKSATYVPSSLFHSSTFVFSCVELFDNGIQWDVLPSMAKPCVLQTFESNVPFEQDDSGWYIVASPFSLLPTVPCSRVTVHGGQRAFGVLSPAIWVTHLFFTSSLGCGLAQNCRGKLSNFECKLSVPNRSRRTVWSIFCALPVASVLHVPTGLTTSSHSKTKASTIRLHPCVYSALVWVLVCSVLTLTWCVCTDIECQGRKGLFPTPEQDPVIQIANNVIRHGVWQSVEIVPWIDLITFPGDPKPFIRNVFCLKSCGNIVGADVLAFDSEADLLLAWKQFLCAVCYSCRWNDFSFFSYY